MNLVQVSDQELMEVDGGSGWRNTARRVSETSANLAGAAGTVAVFTTAKAPLVAAKAAMFAATAGAVSWVAGQIANW